MLPKLLKLDADRRNSILNAALKEFAAKGYDDASTNVIAKEAGISKGLMFHYVNNKKDLFLFLYDYCNELINREYIEVMNFDEKDIFERLRQSYILQIELLQKHPWIFEFNQLNAITKSDEINQALEKRVQTKLASCMEDMFNIVDESKFKQGLDIERCKQFIYWSNIGFTNQILEEIRTLDKSELDYDYILNELDAYLNELRKLFYR